MGKLPAAIQIACNVQRWRLKLTVLRMNRLMSSVRDASELIRMSAECALKVDALFILVCGAQVPLRRL